MTSYDANITLPDTDLIVSGKTILTTAVTSVKVRRLIFDSNQKPLATLLFESDSLLIEAEELITVLDLPGCIRWAHSHEQRAPEPSPQPASPNWPAPAAENGADGLHGTPGVRGTDGLHGRDGPCLTMALGTANGLLVLDINGEDGQQGGAGGQGGDGQAGNRGTPGKALVIYFPPYAECKEGGGKGGNGGQGGQGGDGGNGGHGGDGGHLKLMVKQPAASDIHIKLLNEGGRGASGGKEGAGGKGGAQGKGGRGDGPFNVCNDESENRQGRPGPDGRNGLEGNRGQDGKKGLFTDMSASEDVTNGESRSHRLDSSDTEATRAAKRRQVDNLLSKLQSTLVRVGRPLALGVSIVAWYVAVPVYAQVTAQKSSPGANASGDLNLIVPSSSMRSVDVSLPVAIGQGYHSVLGELRGNALVDDIEGPVQQSPGEGKGSVSQYTVRYLRTSTELRRALNVNAAVDVSYGLFGADAKASLYKSHSVNANSSYLLVNYKVTHSARRLFRFELRPEARALAEADQVAFVRSYGNQFVSGMTFGGELVGVIEFSFKNSAERENFSGSFNASYGPFVSGGIAAESDVYKNETEFSVNASVLRTGGSTSIQLFPEAGETVKNVNQAILFSKKVSDAMLKQAQGFQEEVNKNPVVLAIATMDYNACGPIGKESVGGVRPAIPTLALLQDWVEQAADLLDQVGSKREGLDDKGDAAVTLSRASIYRKLLDPIATERQLADYYSKKGGIVVSGRSASGALVAPAENDSPEAVIDYLRSQLRAEN